MHTRFDQWFSVSPAMTPNILCQVVWRHVQPCVSSKLAYIFIWINDIVFPHLQTDAISS
jgi:hypothetical protein